MLQLRLHIKNRQLCWARRSHAVLRSAAHKHQFWFWVLLRCYGGICQPEQRHATTTSFANKEAFLHDFQTFNILVLGGRGLSIFRQLSTMTNCDDVIFDESFFPFLNNAQMTSLTVVFKLKFCISCSPPSDKMVTQFFWKINKLVQVDTLLDVCLSRLERGNIWN